MHDGLSRWHTNVTNELITSLPVCGYLNILCRFLAKLNPYFHAAYKCTHYDKCLSLVEYAVVRTGRIFDLPTSTSGFSPLNSSSCMMDFLVGTLMNQSAHFLYRGTLNILCRFLAKINPYFHAAYKCIHYEQCLPLVEYAVVGTGRILTCQHQHLDSHL